ncbi:hypothetical protein AYI70_g2415 [Smittium culicis]|uniref:Uncharacterized protein n=1 Tax=Smittium culicis TaxID=133412 RepID=A0A1R1Y8A3_9FUNG|nr:hypothetical protein AYI70_g2415 [Smittium culicis]
MLLPYPLPFPFDFIHTLSFDFIYAFVYAFVFVDYIWTPHHPNSPSIGHYNRDFINWPLIAEILFICELSASDENLPSPPPHEFFDSAPQT